MRKIKGYMQKVLDYMESQNLRGKISVLRILFDIALCTVVYGATISDYFMYRFYQKSAHERNKFITARDKNRFYPVVCDPSARKAIQNKDSFNTRFSSYLNRDSINVPESDKRAFCDFVRAHESVFVKPVALGGGDGIEKLTSDTTVDLEALYDSLCARGQYVVEAGIVQHPVMASLHPQSVNSIRISTLFDGETVHIMFAGMRCGTGEAFVDNHMAGGILMLVDPKSGKVSSRASSKGELNILYHPDTGIYLPGFQIPHWDKCLKLIDRVARQTEGIAYIGWDVAVLQDDVCLIEANPGGDFVTWQEPAQIGRKAELYECITYMQQMATKSGE